MSTKLNNTRNRTYSNAWVSRILHRWPWTHHYQHSHRSSSIANVDAFVCRLATYLNTTTHTSFPTPQLPLHFSYFLFMLSNRAIGSTPRVLFFHPTLTILFFFRLHHSVCSSRSRVLPLHSHSLHNSYTCLKSLASSIFLLRRPLVRSLYHSTTTGD